MAELQLQRVKNVVSFVSGPKRLNPASCFNLHDRVDAAAWREAASQAGYDRMIFHCRDDGDAQDVGNFLSLYRRGESWSRLTFARHNWVVEAWCSLTGADLGKFDTLGGALATVLTGQPPQPLPQDTGPDQNSAVVLLFQPRQPRCDLGSAA